MYLFHELKWCPGLFPDTFNSWTEDPPYLVVELGATSSVLEAYEDTEGIRDVYRG